MPHSDLAGRRGGRSRPPRPSTARGRRGAGAARRRRSSTAAARRSRTGSPPRRGTRRAPRRRGAWPSRGAPRSARPPRSSPSQRRQRARQLDPVPVRRAPRVAALAEAAHDRDRPPPARTVPVRGRAARSPPCRRPAPPAPSATSSRGAEQRLEAQVEAAAVAAVEVHASTPRSGSSVSVRTPAARHRLPARGAGPRRPRRRRRTADRLGAGEDARRARSRRRSPIGPARARP